MCCRDVKVPRSPQREVIQGNLIEIEEVRDGRPVEDQVSQDPPDRILVKELVSELHQLLFLRAEVRQ